jgi:hypothetical protein
VASSSTGARKVCESAGGPAERFYESGEQCARRTSGARESRQEKIIAAMMPPISVHLMM